MKKLLSLLLCYVFLQTETFALRGGPAGSGAQKVLGAYSGIMTETTGTADIGLFLLNAVSAGGSSGQFLLFSQNSQGASTGTSNTYQGLISGLSDTSRGGSGKFVGVFSGTAAVTATTATQSISGQLTVTAVKSAIASGQRLTGTASSRTLTVENNVIVITASAVTNSIVGPLRSYTVDGWQTSTDSQSGGLSLGSSGTGSSGS